MALFDGVVNEKELVKAAQDAMGLPADVPAWLAQTLNMFLDGRVIEVSHPALAQPIRISFPSKGA